MKFVVLMFVVINELDGLAKGSREGQYDSQDHADKVTDRAGQTVQFLEAEFEQKNSHLKAQTSKGTTMETIAFRSEESDMKEVSHVMKISDRNLYTGPIFGLT